MLKVAEPKTAKPEEAEESAAVLVSVPCNDTRRSWKDETQPLVVGDWLGDKDITAWLTNKLYRNEIGEPQAWTIAATYAVSRLQEIRKNSRKLWWFGLEVAAHICR